MTNSPPVLIVLFCVHSLMAQQSYKDIQETFPKGKQYKKYRVIKKRCIPERMYMANFIYGNHDDEQMISLSITDIKESGREGRLIPYS